MAIEAARLFVKIGVDVSEALAGLKGVDGAFKFTGDKITKIGVAFSGLSIPLMMVGKSAADAAHGR